MKNVFMAAGVLVCAHVALATPIQWTSGAGATGKWYDRVDTQGQLSWSSANAAASSLTFNGLQGRLLILNGSDPLAEQAWVRDNVVHPGLGGNQSIFWTGATRPNADGDRLTNWTWEDGSSVPTLLTSTWSIDYFEGNGAYAEGFHNNYGFDYGDYRQDDPAGRLGGFVVEYAAIPAPGAGVIGLTGVMLVGRRRR